MIELLIVVAILALIGTAMFMGLSIHMMKARDSRRKADLEKLKVAFENYYNDNECYPPLDVFFNGGVAPDPALCNEPLAALDPYLKEVPCDPTTGTPYVYYAPEGGDVCDGYRLYTKLENNADPSINKVGCDQGICGTSGEPYTTNNYGISMGAAIPENGFTPSSMHQPSPEPSGFDGNFSCSPNTDPNINGGNPYCKEYMDPQAHGCGASFSTFEICGSYCHTTATIMCDD